MAETVERRRRTDWSWLGASLVAVCMGCAPAKAPAVGPMTRAAEGSRRSAFAAAFRVVEGDVGDFREAEHRLLAVVEDNPNDFAAKRTLARLLNLRLSENDFSKAGLQSDLYASLLGQDVQHPEALSPETFALWCFKEMAGAADQLHRGHRVAALARVNKVERTLIRRRRTHPHEIETHAMAGNYWLNLAGLIPVGKSTRRGRAIEALEVQQARWEEQSILSRGFGIAPGTRAVFSIWLAELLVADRRASEARPHFARVVALAAASDATPAMQSLADHARGRIRLSDSGHAAAQALPPWPNGAQSCIACHSQTHGL